MNKTIFNICAISILFIFSACSSDPDSETNFNTQKIPNSPLSDIRYEGPQPEIFFTYIPPVNSTAAVRGEALNTYGKYKVSLWIKVWWGGQYNDGVGGWWAKYTWASPYGGIAANNSWAVSYVSGGQDAKATCMLAFLVPKELPNYGGGYNIISRAYANAITYAMYNRSGDSSTPTISITNLTNNQITYNKNFTLKGSYWDDRELYGTFLSHNNGTYYLVPKSLQISRGTHSWSNTVTLKEGANSFRVYTKDGSDKTSAVATSATITYINIPLSFINVRDKAKLHTQLIVGCATNHGDVAAIEYSLDNTAYKQAQGIENWSFKLPSSTQKWSIGSQHTISARVRYQNGSYSTPVSIKVTKGKNKDINGDGYEDLVVGAPSSSGASSIKIFYGKASGLSSGSAATADTTISCSSQSLGRSFAVGDINSDGYADLVIGESNYNNGEGRVFIFHGSSSGISSCAASAANHIIKGSSYSQFGNALSLGDITGDGNLDLLVGANNYENGKGAVFLFFGSSAGISSTRASYANARLESDSQTGFGNKIIASDINNDGYADLIVADKNFNTYQGRISIFHGNPFGLNSVTPAKANRVLYGAQGSQFGSSLACSDLNNDGHADLIVGASQQQNQQGAVYILYGAASGIPATASATINGKIGSQFGNTLSVADINNNGYPDLIVGANQYNSSQGEAYIFYNSGNGIPSGSALSANVTINGIAANGFGQAISCRDLNRDGYNELIIAEGTSAINQGWVYIFTNSKIGISSGNSATASALISGSPGYYFGSTLDF